MPPAGVRKGTKRARQYERIKDSQLDQGRSESKAEEIAARTVNKEKGRTREQLYNEARQRGVEGRSKMNKEQLRRAVDARK